MSVQPLTGDALPATPPRIHASRLPYTVICNPKPGDRGNRMMELQSFSSTSVAGGFPDEFMTILATSIRNIVH